MVLTAFQVYSLCYGIKRDLKKLTVGDYTDLSAVKKSKMNNTLLFIGYQVGYSFVGFIVSFIFLSLLVFFFSAIVRLKPVRDFIWNVLVESLFLAPAIFAVIFTIIQGLITHYVFVSPETNFW